MLCFRLKAPLIEWPFGLAVLCALLQKKKTFPKRALFRKCCDVRLGDIKQRFACHCEFADFWARRHFQVAVGGFIFFPVRSKHRGVGLSGRWKAVNFGANYGEADGC